MKYRSTRSVGGTVDFTTAMVTGLAPDGGLYVPLQTPRLPPEWRSWTYQQSVASALALYGAGNTTGLVDEAAAAFTHPDIAPVVEVGNRLVLELFHGPTLSFKDHALQVVTRLLDNEVDSGMILVATSGDTGSAAIEACRGRDRLQIVVLYPQGMVSEFQRRQMTTVPDQNVTTIAVRGTFDDCQALVKGAFARHPDLLAVNSINWARIAAQVGFYIHAATHFDEPFDVVVPTGNFGNVYSCWLAKRMGAHIETITIANNANHTLADLVHGEDTHREPVKPTMAPAMDIQVPSNLERFEGDLSNEFEAGWSTDYQISKTIHYVRDHYDYLIDPHTATAWRAGGDSKTDRPQLIVATAHPSKFDDSIPPPERFTNLFELPELIITIDTDSSELDRLIR